VLQIQPRELSVYPRQGKIGTFVKATDVIAVETLVSNAHPGIERRICWKFFGREADGLSGGPKTSIPDRPSTAFIAFHEYFSG
jgi:hypothetical protein